MTNISKRVLSILLAALLCFGCLACAQTATEPSTAAPAPAEAPADTASEEQKVETAPPEEESYELVFAGWSKEEASYTESLGAVIEKWNAQNPNTPVVWVGWPWADTMSQVILRTQGGEQVDIIQSDINWVTALNAAGAFYDISDIVDKNWIAEAYTDASMQLATRDGRIVGLPWTIASIGTIYNADLLKAAGVEKAPATIEEFESALEAIKKYDNSIVPYALSTKDATCATDFAPWVYAFGGSIIDQAGTPVLSSEAGIQALEWIKHLYDSGYIRLDMSRFDARVLYGQEKVGFYHDAFGSRSTLVENGIPQDQVATKVVAMTRPVVQAGDVPTSTMWGWTLNVGKNCAHPEKALEFIRFMVSEEIYLDLWETNSLVPATKTALKNDVYQQNVFLQDWAKITETGQLMESGNYTCKSSIETILTECVQSVITGKLSAAEAAAKADRDIADAIKNAN